MSILRTGIFAEFVLFSLCAVAPLTAAAQVSGAPPPVAEATLDFLPDQTDPIALKCDALADYPGDPHRVGDGVAFERIGVVDALPVCEQAATRLPARPRYQYLYGRVLSAAQRYDEAARQFSMADQAGYALATYNIGNFYAEGMGVAQDRDKAASFYFRAGNAGFADAFAELGMIYIDSASPNFPEARTWFERAVQDGSNTGRTYLGELYATGQGLEKDFAKAAALFGEAAQSGEPEGMFDLGLMYRDGTGVPTNPAAAFDWLSRAAQNGYPMAMLEVGNIYYAGRNGAGSEDHRAAFSWYLRAANAQVGIAQRYVGYMYERGDGVTQSGPDAVTWYRSAAMHGDGVAMMLLGRQLRLMPSAEDKATGIQWLQRASESGSVEAQIDLAMAYDDGEDGLPRDHQQAAHWFGEAADQGNGFAQVQLGEMYQRGVGVDRDLDQAQRLFWRAEASSDPQVVGMARTALATLRTPPSPVQNAAPNPAPQPSAVTDLDDPSPQPKSATDLDDTSPPPRRLPPAHSVRASNRSDAAANTAIGIGAAIGAIMLFGYLAAPDHPSDGPWCPACTQGKGHDIGGGVCLLGSAGCNP